MRPRTGGRAGLPGWLGWSVVTLSLMGLATLTQASTCPLMSQHPAPCGPRGTCHLAARRPILSSSTTQPPDPHMVTCSCPDCGLRSAPTSGKAQTLSLTPNPGRVPVVDHVTLGPSCPIGSLVAGVTYWCQGKPGGCSLDPLVVRSLALPCNMSNGLEVRWHEEGDYNSREIPCPSYGHGALEKKFIPLENTCFIKTVVRGDWRQAREQCWDWGGELAFPLPANNTTPKSWLQDSEEIWLAGSSEFHARPGLETDSPEFQEGTYMVCFSDLWRCTQGGPHLDQSCQTGPCHTPRRGLCAIPPRRQEKLSPDCHPITDTTWGLVWPAQPAGSSHSQPCPANQRGQVVWGCGRWGLRTTPEPDFSSCVLTNLEQHMLSLPGSDPSTVLDTVNQDIKEQGGELASGDIEAIVGLLDAASNIQELHVSRSPPDKRAELSERFWVSSAETVDQLVSHPAVWLGLDQQQANSQVDSLQVVVDTAARQLVENLDPGTESLEVRHTEHLDMQLKVVDKRAKSTFGVGGSEMSIEIGVNDEEEGDSTNQTSMIVFKSFNNLGCIINRQRSCDAPTLNEVRPQKQVNSKVIGADVYSEQKQLVTKKVEVVIIFEHVFKGGEYNLSSTECVFWDSYLSNWNSSGCITLETGPEFTRCQCSHLTNFAVLMDINGIFSSPDAPFTSLLHYLTIICSSLSLAGLVCSLYVFTMVPGLKSDRTLIHRHLCSLLLLAHLLLLTGLDATSVPFLCTGVAICLHWLFLAAFSWMLVEGFHIYKMLTDVFQTKRCGLVPYYLLGYGLPTLTVAATLTASEVLELNGYGTDDYCWLDASSGFIWAFGGPVAFVVLMNILIYVLAMTVARLAIQRNNNMEKYTKLVTWLKGSSSLLSILGIGWVFGFLYLNEGSRWMGVVFTLLNSLQGVAIFFLHVIFNDLAMKKLKAHMQRKFHILEFRSLSRTATSKHTMRKAVMEDSEMSFVEDGLSRSESSKVKHSVVSDSGLGSSCHEMVSKTEGTSSYGSMKNNNYYPGPEPEPDY